MNEAELIEALRTTLDPAIGADAYDLDLNEEGAIELAADEWTLIIESWPTGIAFLALDDEPETGDSAELQRFLERLLGPVLPALAAAGPEIVVSLHRSRDPLSIALAKLIDSTAG